MMHAARQQLGNRCNAYSRGPLVLTLNAGSSSLRIALFSVVAEPLRVFSGVIERIGLPTSNLTLTNSHGYVTSSEHDGVSDHRAALQIILPHACDAMEENELAAVGHRIVHGGELYTQPTVVTPEIRQEIERLIAFAPDHLPAELELLVAMTSRFPRQPQVACFDTAFHRDLPLAAHTLPIPRCYTAAGVRRYGFHGLSYEFLLEELQRIRVPQGVSGRVVLAHLGSGCSLAAVRDGACIDTSMAFTPASGMMMGRRSGDLDPGVLTHLSRTEGMTIESLDRMVNQESGLLGVSGTSSDMGELLTREISDSRAAEAVEMFCYAAKKWIGAFAAALGGIDALVFSGGIGENAPRIRARICDGLDFLGIGISDALNAMNDGLISDDESRVLVRVIRTDEEVMIARSVCRMLDLSGTGQGVSS